MSGYRCDYTSHGAFTQQIDKEIRARKAAEAFWALDFNDDGKIDRNEAKAMNMTDATFALIDRNNDGFIGEDEMGLFQKYAYEEQTPSQLEKTLALVKAKEERTGQKAKTSRSQIAMSSPDPLRSSPGSRISATMPNRSALVSRPVAGSGPMSAISCSNPALPRIPELAGSPARSRLAGASELSRSSPALSQLNRARWAQQEAGCTAAALDGTSPSKNSGRPQHSPGVGSSKGSLNWPSQAEGGSGRRKLIVPGDDSRLSYVHPDVWFSHLRERKGPLAPRRPLKHVGGWC